MVVHTHPILRAARLPDAEAISWLISEALRQTNAVDYSPSVIERMIVSYSAPRIGMMIRSREMFVAEIEREVVGTIGYAAGTVRSLFVLPSHQGLGLGRQLLSSVEEIARNELICSLTVAASLTAVGFYRHHGFDALRPIEASGIAMMLMHKWLRKNDELPVT